MRTLPLRYSALLLLALPLIRSPAAQPDVAREYGTMGWQDGLRDPNYRIETSRFTLNYNHHAFGPTAISAHAEPPAEYPALRETPEPRIKVSFTATISGNGSTATLRAASDDLRTSMLVESGRFFQRRWQVGAAPGGVPLDPDLCGLETAAWPDRLSFVLRVTPTAAVTNGWLEMTFALPGFDGTLEASGPGGRIVAKDGTGFVAQGLPAAATFRLEPASSTLILRTPATDWPAGQEVKVGLILHPSSPMPAQDAARVMRAEDSPLEVSASCVEPQAAALKVDYDAGPGFHRIQIPKGGEGDDGLMRARIRITNPDGHSRRARLCFDGVPFYVPGLTAVLCDEQGVPTGVPVQLSKNWHNSKEALAGTGGFWGQWFHGLTMVDVPAATTREVELVVAGENWAGLAAASHAQLSVIGYGGQQQWDEAALGNRGEALCYDMDHVLTQNSFTDSRPFAALDLEGRRNWGINVGGGSVLRYTDAAGVVRRYSRMRVRYTRYGPNLTEAVYAGRTDDGAMAFSYSAGMFRSDDCTRGLHRIRIDVLRDAGFQRLAFYQQPGDTYCYNPGDRFAVGDAAHAAPLREWKAAGKPGDAAVAAIPLAGPSPWVATLGGKGEGKFRPADHGFVVRSWQARIGGRPMPQPLLRERVNPRGVSLMELVPPDGVDRLTAGDFVEADIVRVVVPRSLDNYGGGNAAFREALRAHGGDARLILREAAGNHIAVETTTGRLTSLHPVRIATEGDRAEFVLTGGLGAVPVTFGGLSRAGRPVLEQKSGDDWKRLESPLPGRIDWQCDARPDGFEITCTLVPDGPAQSIEEIIAKPVIREFRLRLE